MNELLPFTIPLWSLTAILAPFANLFALKSIDNLAFYQSKGVDSPVLSATNLCPVLF